jgi:hypothetical protein
VRSPETFRPVLGRVSGRPSQRLSGTGSLGELLTTPVLVLVVVTYFATNWPYSRSVVSFNGVLVVFVLAVLANICYCTVYVGDVFVQVSGFRESWLKWRWVLLVIGTVFAATIARWFAIGFFTPPHAG